MPAQVKHRLTPWGKQVTHAMIDRDLGPAELADMLRERGFRVSRTDVVGMLRGYRGKRGEEKRTAINEILGIVE